MHRCDNCRSQLLRSRCYDGGVTQLVPVDDAAAAVGVHRATVFRYIKQGLLKRYKAPGVDRRTFVDVDALRELRQRPPLREVP